MHADTDDVAVPLIPARMVNEVTYCPRLFYLEWVDRDFDDNHFTVEGRAVHERVDEGEPTTPLGGEGTPWQARSVELSSSALGVSARIDLVEAADGEVIPVETKRGKAPDVPEGAYEPELVQLCLYGLLLREAGYRVERGEFYFAGSRQRVEVPFDDALVARTMAMVELARSVSTSAVAPPPLVSSPKCAGCSLAGLCLPDEVNLLAGVETNGLPRALLPARDDAQPLYVQELGAKVGVSGHCLQVKDREQKKLLDAPLVDVSHVVLMGNVQMSSQAIREVTSRGVPVAWLSTGGWLSGLLDGLGHGQVALRRAQYAAADDPARRLALARAFVTAKIANSRTFMRRNLGVDEPGLMLELSQLGERAASAESLETLLGLEGNAARLYFENFSRLLSNDALGTFDFKTRNRRPPKDAVNALLSFAYSMLTKDVAVAARLVGFDPYLGFLHQPRAGRFSLALDVMEELRPIVADSVVVNVINMCVVTSKDFIRRGVGVTLNAEGRKKVLKAWERRLSEQVTHPLFGYRVSYRRIFEMQCRLLARHLRGEIPEYPGFKTR
jgi:CRISPR-associated protein Cas1